MSKINKKYSTPEFIEKANIVHNNKFDYDNVFYANSKTKVIITCRIHGDFPQAPASHLMGIGCPKCDNKNKEYLSFKEAKQYVKNLKFKNQKEYFTWHTSNKPENLPYMPMRIYKNEWINWHDWLGKEGASLTEKGKQFLSFEEAREYVRKLNLKSRTEYNIWYKENRPDFLPSTPTNKYKREWTSMGDFLGTGRVADQFKKTKYFLSLKEAREYVKTLNLQSEEEYMLWHRKTKPINLPAYPPAVYGNDEGWTSMGDFLGTNYVALAKREFISFEDAKKLMQSLGIKTQKQYFEWYKINKPDNMPSSPEEYYKNHK